GVGRPRLTAPPGADEVRIRLRASDRWSLARREAGRPARYSSGLGGRLALLVGAGLLAAELAQAAELGGTGVAAGDDLDRLDRRGVHREGALDADAEADLADGERLTDAVAAAGDDDALERLDAGAGALDDLDVHLEGVAGAELGDVGPQRCCVDGVERVHD